MNVAALKSSAKRHLRPMLEKAGGFLPPSVRDELVGFWQAHLAIRGRRRSPYWERREKPGVSRRLVRIGFVGAGRYAQNHLKVLTHLDQVEIKALLTTGGPRAETAAREFGISRTYTDPDAFFSADDVDAFVIVVPPEYLKEMGLRGLRTGKPVLMEKPPGISAADTAELVACAEQHGTFGMVCLNRRFYSVLEHGLAHLAGCGPIRGMTVEIPQQVTRDRQSGRVSAFDHEHYFQRMSIHGVDLIRYVLGEPLAVHSLSFPNNDLHHATASYATVFEFPGQVVATMTDIWDSTHLWRVKIIAEFGWVELEPLESGHIGTAAAELHGGGRKTEIRVDPIDVEFRAGVYAQDLHFVEAVRSGKPPLLPACLLPDAHKTMLVMDQIMSGTLPRANTRPHAVNGAPRLVADHPK
jgi:predicted dehydrogenase